MSSMADRIADVALEIARHHEDLADNCWWCLVIDELDSIETALRSGKSPVAADEAKAGTGTLTVGGIDAARTTALPETPVGSERLTRQETSGGAAGDGVGGGDSAACVVLKPAEGEQPVSLDRSARHPSDSPAQDEAAEIERLKRAMCVLIHFEGDSENEKCCPSCQFASLARRLIRERDEARSILRRELPILAGERDEARRWAESAVQEIGAKLSLLPWCDRLRREAAAQAGEGKREG